MRKTIFITAALAAAFCLGFLSKPIFAKQTGNMPVKQTGNNDTIKKGANMKLGVFSISLSVKDLKTSKEFYENLGFVAFAGGMEKNYVVMKNEHALIGLFQGMFKGNILTFNPGWDENAHNIEPFDDVRTIQHQLKSKGIKLTTEADEKTTGPAGFMLTDPDGNMVLIDQHR